MPDEPNPHVSSKAADHDRGNEIENSVAQRIKHNSCPFCENQKWYVVTSDEMKPPLSGVVMTNGHGTIPAYTFICGNCGFVRQHVSSVVDGQTIRMVS